MTDNRPIGILDSGIGGMSVLKQALKVLPDEKYIYVCDQKNLPYGDKSKELIIQLTRKMVNYLINKNVKVIVFACNTATAQALDTIQAEVDIPLIGIIRAGSIAGTKVTQGDLGLIATKATVASNRYPEEIAQIDDKIKVTSCATPKLVPAIEGQDPNLKAIINEELAIFKDVKIDSLILGCTHYPLIADQISEFFVGQVNLIDPSIEVVRELEAHLQTNGLLTDNKSNNSNEYYTSGNVENFTEIAQEWLQNSSIKAEKVTL